MENIPTKMSRISSDRILGLGVFSLAVIRIAELEGAM